MTVVVDFIRNLNQSRPMLVRVGSGLSLLTVMLLGGYLLTRNCASAATGPQEKTRALTELREAVNRAANQPGEGILAGFEKKYPDSEVAALARFRRGYDAYTGRNFAQAIKLLDDPLFARYSQLGDYALYYLGKAQNDAGQYDKAQATLLQLPGKFPKSLLVRDAILQAGRAAASTKNIAAVEANLKPLLDAGDGGALLILANAYNAAGRKEDAARTWARIPTEAPQVKESEEAKTAYTAIFGAPTPNPTPDTKALLSFIERESADAKRLQLRASREYDTRRFVDASETFGKLSAANPAALQSDEARFRYGVSLYFAQKYPAAANQLATVSAKDKELHAEALFYQGEAQRKSSAPGYPATVERLLSLYPKSPKAGEALAMMAQWSEKRGGAAGYFDRLVRNYPEQKVGQQWHYKRGWTLHQAGDFSGAAQLLTEHVALFPSSDYKGMSAYWAARDMERTGRSSDAKAMYEAIIRRYKLGYYGQMSARRLDSMKSVPAPKLDPNSTLAKACASIQPARPLPETIGPEGDGWMERASQLRIIGLADLSLAEMEEARKTAPNSPKVNREMARVFRDRGETLRAVQTLQRAHPDYLAYQNDEVTREEWEIFFPLREWETIKRESQVNGLDPYIVAGLIRQESVFNPNARSRANAIGMMQMLPSTGRLVAKKKTGEFISGEQLYNPTLNITLGTSYLAEMYRKYGRYEYAFAAYNAGPGRVAQWLNSLPTGELDVWVDSIPISETRLYVQGVTRNAAHYRRLYGE